MNHIAVLAACIAAVCSFSPPHAPPRPGAPLRASKDESSWRDDARAAAESGDFERAERLFSRAAASHPADAGVANSLGAVRLARGDPSAARTALERALALDDERTDVSARARFNLGHACLALREPFDAAEHFRGLMPDADATDLFACPAEAAGDAGTGADDPQVVAGLAAAAAMARHHTSAVALYDAAIARFGGRDAAPAEILFNRANSLADGGGRDADAIAGFDEYLAKGAVEGLSSADVAAATFFRGIVERRAGRRDAAAASLEAAAPELASADDAAVARRLLATLQRAGAADGTDGADDVAYSRWLFDGYAESFDDELRRLGYTMPQLLADAVVDAAGAAAARPRFARAADLGAGTGLAARALRAVADVDELVGVDVSRAMLARAPPGLYDRTVEADAHAALADEPPRTLDLIVMCDVFCYVRDPAPVLANARAALRPRGLFALTLEEEDAAAGELVGVLRESGRYAHSSAALATSAVERFGFELALEPQTGLPLRMDEGAMIEGSLVVLRRRG